jgi:hypothetical protein
MHIYAANFNDGGKLGKYICRCNSSTITYTADNHVFQDVVAKDFADDAAAASGTCASWWIISHFRNT